MQVASAQPDNEFAKKAVPHGRDSEIDSPLKLLVSLYSTEFAAWLLRADVRQTRPLATDLPGALVLVDQVFAVTLTSGQQVLLHIEFQGRRSHQPMSWRMLDYWCA